MDRSRRIRSTFGAEEGMARRRELVDFYLYAFGPSLKPVRDFLPPALGIQEKDLYRIRIM
jgi:hypothetical protein